VEEPEDSEHGHGHDHSPSSSDHDGGHDHSSDSLCHDGHDHDHVALIISEPGDLGTHPTPPAPAPAPGVTSFITRKFQAIAQIGHDKHEIDNNFRATFFHVVADAFVSMLVIFALVIAGNVPSLYFFDPMMGIIGSGVILSWAWQLILDSGANLLDMNPDKAMCQALRKCLERDGSSVKDLHVWRLGPGHLGAVISVAPPSPCSEGAKYSAAYYHSKMSGFRAISHVTVEVL
jgi:cation diffusion facilitator family transporter